MRAQVFTVPQKHVVVDDFVTPAERQALLDECATLQAAMGAGTVLRAHTEVGGSFKKRNKNVWLDTHYQGRRGDSTALTIFKDRFFSQPIRDAFRETGDLLFQNALHANADCVLLSVYGPGDFYADHHDEYPSVTANLMISSIPKRFTGGDFFLGDDSPYEPQRETRYTRLDFVPGRLVIFPGRARHYVDTIHGPDLAFLDGRFTFQYWPQFLTTAV